MAYLRTLNYTGQTVPSVNGELTINGSLNPNYNDCEIVGGTLVGQVYITNVRNFRLAGMDISNPGGIGVYVEQTGTQDVLIENNLIHDCGKEGVYVNQGQSTTAPRHVNMVVRNNRVYNAGQGVTGDTAPQRCGIIVYASDAVVEGNDVNNVGGSATASR